MAGTNPGTGKGLWHGWCWRVGAVSMRSGTQPALASPGRRLAGVWCLTGCWLRADVVLAIHRAGYLRLPC